MESDGDNCKTYFVHRDVVKEVLKTIQKDEILYDLSDFFKMFGDATRIKILQALFISELCVCDLADLLKISQSAVSHQLRTLRHANLVKFRKEGKVVFYSLKDDHVKEIIDIGMQHINEPGFGEEL